MMSLDKQGPGWEGVSLAERAEFQGWPWASLLKSRPAMHRWAEHVLAAVGMG